MSNISVWQLLMIAVIVALLFGTDKLRTLGSDLGASIRGFRKAINDDNHVNEQSKTQDENLTHQTTIEPEQKISSNKDSTKTSIDK